MSEEAAGGRSLTWLLLSLLFLAHDELWAIHELLIDPMRQRFDLSGLLHFAWIPVYLLLVAAVAWMFWPALWDLERRLRMWFAAALAFLSETVFFDMLGAPAMRVTKGTRRTGCCTRPRSRSRWLASSCSSTPGSHFSWDHRCRCMTQWRRRTRHGSPETIRSPADTW